MRCFSLSPRLKMCAEFISGKKIVDIGTDHAYLPVYLALGGEIDSAIAADINPEPLKRGENNIAKYGVEDTVTVRLSDGLDSIAPEEADDIVIAGMGGELIAKIVLRTAWTKNPSKHLILQPMSRPEVLREQLFLNGYDIKKEKCVVSEGRLYTVMSVCYTANAAEPSPRQKYLGKLDKSDDPELYEQYLERITGHLTQKARGYMLDNKTEEYKRITNIIKQIKE